MTESVLPPTSGQAVPESNGIESVEAVVSGLDALDDLPVAEHVAVFERAHESLRALMGQSSGAQVGEPPRASPQG